MTTRNWMRALAEHHGRMRRAYPEDRLCIVFDIDGTIIDLRHQMAHVLHAYDHAQGTAYFRDLTPEAIRVDENAVEELLRQFGVPGEVRPQIAAWYRRKLWARETMLAAHRPYRGVLSVIRWFQLQPDTVVALNTGRPDALRSVTLESLERLGSAHRVRFSDELLCMNPNGWGEHVLRAKVEGIRRLRSLGLRIFAVVDNEPENIVAMAEDDPAEEILFLHADTIFSSRRVTMPRTVSGSAYGLPQLVREEDLVGRVQFVWHGVNDGVNLRQFLASDVHWAEVDVRADPEGRLVLRHDPFDVVSWVGAERPPGLVESLERLHQAGRSVKIDLKEGGRTFDDVRSTVRDLGIPANRLWFNGAVEVLRPKGFRTLAREFSGSIVSCPADFLVPLLLAEESLAREILNALRDWGLNRLSLSWATSSLSLVLDRLQDAGWAVNVYDVPDLPAFLETALLLPSSVTADFNFPEWHYFGRGSGARGVHHRYELDDPGQEADAGRSA